MLNRLLKLFAEGRLDEAAINRAVKLGWITEKDIELFEKEA